MPSRAHASSALMRRALHDTCRGRPALKLLRGALCPAERATGRDHGAGAAEDLWQGLLEAMLPLMLQRAANRLLSHDLAPACGCL